MAKYMLLLYDEREGRDAFIEKGPEVLQKAMEKYIAWAKRPYVISTQGLTPDGGRVIKPVDGHLRVSDGPFIESKEVLGGIYLIEAANYEEAVRLAMDHPQLEHGTVEIRQVWGS